MRPVNANPPSWSLRRASAARSDSAPAPSSQRTTEETPRPDDEHGGHEDEDREDGKAGDEQDAEGQHLTVDERAEKGPPEGPEPADHDDDECLDDHLGVHPGHDG